MTKFISNAPEISRKLSLTSKEIEKVKEKLVSSDSSSHALGLKWDHIKDTLVVSRDKSLDKQKNITQRTVLSFVSSLLDPIGLVAPYTVQAQLKKLTPMNVQPQQLFAKKKFMTDFFDSMPNAEQAVNLSRELIKKFTKGGFKLTKFISNAPEISRKLSLTSKEIEKVKEKLVSSDSSSHALGLKWDHIKDTLVVSRDKTLDKQKNITQRTILSFVPSLLRRIRYKLA